MSKRFWKTLALSLLVVLLSLVGVVGHLLMPQRAIAQVTSMSQIADVSETDWYYQALQSMVERYGVLGVYPDGTFRANRPSTRGEIAGLISASLDTVVQSIDATTSDMATQQEFAVMRQAVEQLTQEVNSLKTAQQAKSTCGSASLAEAESR